MPITREEVIEWSERVLGQTMQHNTRGASPTAGEWLLNLQQSVERMLDDSFRAKFNEALYGDGQLDRRRHFDPIGHPEDLELLQTCRVREIAWPSWLPPDGRYQFMAAFPVPVFHWSKPMAAATSSEAAPTHRSPLHFFEMRWHPQYVLVCSRCDWPQGPRGGAEIFNSKAPSLREQLNLIGAEAAKAGGVGHDQRFLEIWQSISHEVWGWLVFHLAPGNKDIHDMTLNKDRLHYLFDSVLGFTGVPMEGGLGEDFGERLRIVGWILERLQCRNCLLVKCVRYRPRILLPIDVDLSPQSQAKRATSLAKRLRATRPKDASDPLHAVFWFPEDVPRKSPRQLAIRIALSRARAGVDPDPILIFHWLTPPAWNSGDSWSDDIETEVLYRDPEPEVESLSSLLDGLRTRICALPREDPLDELVGSFWNLLHESEFRALKRILLSHYRTHELPRLLADRKYKASRPSRRPT